MNETMGVFVLCILPYLQEHAVPVLDVRMGLLAMPAHVKGLVCRWKEREKGVSWHTTSEGVQFGVLT